MTLKNSKASPLYYIKICASFQIHWWIRIGVTVRKRSIQVKIGDFFLSHLTSKFYRWPWKTVVTSSIPCQTLCIISNPSVKSNLSYSLETLNSLQNWRVFFCMTFKFDGWLWKTIENLFYTILNFVHHFKSIGEMKLELQSGNAQFGSKLAIFGPTWPRKLTDDLKTIGRLYYTTLSFVHHFKAMGIFKLELQSGNAQFRSKLVIFCPTWPWKLTDDLEKQ